MCGILVILPITTFILDERKWKHASIQIEILFIILQDTHSFRDILNLK